MKKLIMLSGVALMSLTLAACSSEKSLQNKVFGRKNREDKPDI